MSRKVSISSLTDKQLENISNELQIQQEASKYSFNATPITISLLDTEQDDLFLPFAYAKKFPRPERESFPSTDIPSECKLRDYQKSVKIEALNSLNLTGSVIISCYCGFGKTFLGLYIATKLKLKTLIVCNRIQLIKQWVESIQKFFPEATSQVLTAQSKMKDCDFYIVNATNVPKHSRSFYASIGCLIVDECHLILAEKLSSCMRYIFPRYLIGLSATPYRPDGLDILFDMYFGKTKVVRKLHRLHTVYRINTGIKPEVELNRMGKVDWGSVIASQCDNEVRNEMIIKVIKHFSDRVFLVLCKRVSQANFLVKRLEEEGEDVTSLIGKNQEYEKTSRILIGTSGKLGTGFDHPRLDSMILASDVEQYFVQYLGRVFRREDVTPFIFDFVDNYGLLIKHFRTRNSVYLEHGGIVKDFSKEFPNFFSSE